MLEYEYYRLYLRLQPRTSEPHQSAVLAWTMLHVLTLMGIVFSLETWTTLGHAIGAWLRAGHLLAAILVYGGISAAYCVARDAGDDKLAAARAHFDQEDPRWKQLRATAYSAHWVLLGAVWIIAVVLAVRSRH